MVERIEGNDAQPLPPVDFDTAAGNFVVQSLGRESFALYAHLQPGSLRVQVGYVLERGEVLGLVGNSGNSTQPHLHFQVMDQESPLFSNGRPFAFDRFALVATLDVGGPEPQLVVTPEPQSRRRPLNFDVVRFDGSR